MTFLTTPFVRSFVGFDTLFDELERVSTHKEASYPAYNIEKTGENSYEISIALAGFSENELSLELKQNLLTLEAKNRLETDNKNYLHKGIANRAFKKQFRLADNMEVETASFRDGLLIVRLVRFVPEEDLSRRIEINAKPRKLKSSAA